MFLKNRNFYFWGSKTKKNRKFVKAILYLESDLVVVTDLASFGAFGGFTFKPYIPEAFECWPFFDTKSCDMTSLKRHFLRNQKTALLFKLLKKFARGRYTPPPQPMIG